NASSLQSFISNMSMTSSTSWAQIESRSILTRSCTQSTEPNTISSTSLVQSVESSRPLLVSKPILYDSSAPSASQRDISTVSFHSSSRDGLNTSSQSVTYRRSVRATCSICLDSNICVIPSTGGLRKHGHGGGR